MVPISIALLPKACSITLPSSLSIQPAAHFKQQSGSYYLKRTSVYNSVFSHHSTSSLSLRRAWFKVAILGKGKANNSFCSYRAYIPYFEGFIIRGRDKKVGIWWPSNIRDTLKPKKTILLALFAYWHGKMGNRLHIHSWSVRNSALGDANSLIWLGYSSFDSSSFSVGSCTPKTSMASSHSSYCGHQHPFMEFTNSILYKLIWISGFSSWQMAHSWSELLRAGGEQDSTGFSSGESSFLLLKLQHVTNFGKQNKRVWEFVFSLQLWRMSKCCVYVDKATRKIQSPYKASHSAPDTREKQKRTQHSQGFSPNNILPLVGGWCCWNGTQEKGQAVCMQVLHYQPALHPRFQPDLVSPQPFHPQAIAQDCINKEIQIQTDEQAFCTKGTMNGNVYMRKKGKMNSLQKTHFQAHRDLLILTSLWPDIVFSNLPSYAPQILISLSAAGKERAS